ncbi:GntR family transcriptional regulator [Paenibacillus chartarius]|uniref:GntR family transcriptional regulator n=1 Tax=Paenibacillus chartarius TaxID=747481 RepID=A0ABV6DRP9_9BACL
MSTRTGLPKLDTSNLWDKSYNILKEKIIRREFLANEKLSIPELAEQLGVSRTPIRDALNRLEMDGLVKTVSKVGTFVNAIEIEDVQNIMDTRLMLEFWVADKIAAQTKDQIQQEVVTMEQILQTSKENIEILPLDTYLQYDYNMAFHLEYMNIGKNKRNMEIYKSIMNYRFLAAQASLITKEMVTTALEQHTAILHAVKEGSMYDIKTMIKLHLDDSKMRLLEKIHANGGAI